MSQLAPDALARVVKAARKVETTRRPDIGQGQSMYRGQSPVQQTLAACLSTTATAGLYPAMQVCQQSAASGPPVAAVPPPGAIIPGTSPVSLPSGLVPIGTGAQDCWLQFNSGIKPTAGYVYSAQVSGRVQPFGLTPLPIIFSDQSGGSSGPTCGCKGSTCCPDGLPSVLYATLGNVVGCDCASGTIALIFDPATGKWTGSGPFGTCGSNTITISFYCLAGGVNESDLVVDVSFSDNCFPALSGQTGTQGRCSPLLKMFPFGLAPTNLCGCQNVAQVGYQFTVTQ